MNYFTIKQCSDLGNGFVLLVLGHDYGHGPDIRLPIEGTIGQYPVGRRVELTLKVLQ